MALIIENDVIKKYVPEPGEDVILIPDTVKEIAENVFYRCGNIKEVIICGNDLVIGRGAFAYCTSLQSVTFRGTIRSIRGKKDFPVEGSAMAPFECCSALETVNFEGKIGSMGGAVFMDCNSLRSLVIRGEINYFGGSFISEDYYGLDGSYLGCVENCKNLEEVIIEGSINVMGLCAFKQCYSLKKIHIKGNVGHIGGEILTRDPYWGYSITEPFPAVSICGELSGESILHIIIDGDVETISSEAFAFCSGLKSVEISGTVATIGESAFCSCSSLESVIISGEVGEIEKYAFKDCSKLEKVLINGTVKNIKNYAFSNLSSLVKMEYPAKVHEIEWLAFDLCEKLVVEVDNIPLIGSKHLMQQADVVKNRNYSKNLYS